MKEKIIFNENSKPFFLGHFLRVYVSTTFSTVTGESGGGGGVRTKSEVITYTRGVFANATDGSRSNRVRNAKKRRRIFRKPRERTEPWVAYGRNCYRRYPVRVYSTIGKRDRARVHVVIIFSCGSI